MRELRRDPLFHRWVLVTDEQPPADRAAPDPTAPCPLCPGREALAPHELYAERRGDDGRWRVRVVPNRAPLLAVEGLLQGRGFGPYDWHSAIGAHEVVIESPRHDVDLDDLALDEIESVLVAWRERIVDLKRDSRFQYLHAFRTRGALAGARLHHPHSQILALPFVPPLVTIENEQAERHYTHHGRCLLCDLVANELNERRRIVVEQRDFVAFCPYASKAGFEVWIVPRHHRPTFEHTPHGEIVQLAALLGDVIGRLRRATENASYIAALHNSPTQRADRPHLHYSLRLQPVLSHTATALATLDMPVNPVPPEIAAAHLRELPHR